MSFTEVFNKKDQPSRKRLIFHGRVQGVGFRYEVIRAAKRLNLSGWVKNKADLTVVCEAQGVEENIERLVFHMRSLRRANVTKVESTSIPLVEGEADFKVAW